MGIREALFKRFPAPAWALFFEVHNTTGYGRSRSADALAMGLWPSRGLELHGFEFKDDRGDWLNELKNPAKAETIAKYCDYWWLVAGNTNVVKKVEEVPAGWGYLQLQGQRMTCIKQAPKLEAIPVTRGFLAAILRRQHESILDAPEVQAKLESMKKDLQSREKDNWSFEAKENSRELERLKSAVSEFEKISGVTINKWQAGRIGEAVKEVMNVQSLLNKSEDSITRARDVKETLTKALNSLEGDIQRLTYVKELAQKQLAQG